jgi:hypothetical protein
MTPTSPEPRHHQPNQRPSASQLESFSTPQLALTSNFYQQATNELVVCCGHEVGTPDYHSAIDLLNAKLMLRLDDVDRKALAMMLTGLSNAKRFGGEIHMSPSKGENSAAHSCHAAILATEIFRRAHLLTPENHTAQTSEMRLAVTLGCLVHDMGEICGELSSLAQRATNKALEELPHIEREIFRISLTEAFRAAGNYPSASSQFYTFLRDMRASLGLHKNGIADTPPQLIIGKLSKYAELERTTPLAPELGARVNSLLHVYDMAEMRVKDPSPSLLFLGNAVKVVEHLQGLRHFMRFARVEARDFRKHLFSPETTKVALAHEEPSRSDLDSVPMRYMSSYRLIKNVNYIEKEIPQLFTHAESRPEQALAHALRDAAYQSQIEWFSIGRPVVDRTCKAESEKLVHLTKRYGEVGSSEEQQNQRAELTRFLALQLHKDSQLFQRRQANEGADSLTPASLRPIESRIRIIALYDEALRVSYEPTSQIPLMLMPEVPSALRGFEAKPRPRDIPPAKMPDELGLRDAGLPPPPLG